MKTLKQNFPVLEWMLGFATTVLAVLAWYQFRGNTFDGLDAYAIFPLLGILAFSYMWTHYVLWALNIAVGGERSDSYREVSGLAVLALLLLHPGLIIIQLNKDGFGLPLGSFELYVGASMIWAVVIAQIALLAFLAFEFHSKFGKKSWWKYVNIANVAAMILIFVHAKQIGGVVNYEWFELVWWAYGAVMVASFVYIIYRGKLLK